MSSLLVTAPSCGPVAASINGDMFWDTTMIQLSGKTGATTSTYTKTIDADDSTKRWRADLTFNGVTWRDRDNFIERGTSYVAFHAFDAMPDSMRKTYSRIKIELNTDSGKFDREYTMNHIGWVHLLSHLVTGFYEKMTDTSFAAMLDQRYIDSSLVDSIVTLVNRAIPGSGKIDYEVIAFGSSQGPNYEHFITICTRCSREGKFNEINFTLSEESLAIVNIQFPFGFIQ